MDRDLQETTLSSCAKNSLLREHGIRTVDQLEAFVGGVGHKYLLTRVIGISKVTGEEIISFLESRK